MDILISEAMRWSSAQWMIQVQMLEPMHNCEYLKVSGLVASRPASIPGTHVLVVASLPYNMVLF